MVEATSKTAKEILIGAAQAIRERGLARGVMCDLTGAVCTIGAMKVAREGTADGSYGDLFKSPEGLGAVSALLSTLGIFHADDLDQRTAVYDWNDNARADVVIEALERAAEVTT